MSNDFGVVYNIDTDPAVAAAGPGSNVIHNQFGNTGIGQFYNGVSYITSFGMAAFDLTDLPTDVDHVYFQNIVEGYQSADSDFTVYIAPYDYGTTLEESDWLDPAALAALTPIGSYSTADLNPSGNSNTVLIELDMSGITLGAINRFVLYTDKQRDGEVPTTAWRLFGFYPNLILKRDYVDPGSNFAYSVEVLADDPELYWTLDELSGTVLADSSPNGNDGSLSGGANSFYASADTASNSNSLYSPAVDTFQATNNSAELQSHDSTSFANAVAGSTFTLNSNPGTARIGGRSESTDWYAYETFVEFDTSTLSAAARVTLMVHAVAGTFVTTDQPQVMKVAAYDYGTADTTDWRNSTQLGALTVAGSIATTNDPGWLEIDIDPAAINVGGTTRLVVYTDALVTVTAPTSGGNDTLWTYGPSASGIVWPWTLVVTQTNEPTYSDARDGVDGASFFDWYVARGLPVGQELVDSQYRCYETFLQFDHTTATGTVTAAILNVSIADLQVDTDFDLKIALYDYGSSLTSGDFRTGSQLAGLTEIASYPVTTSTVRQTVEFDLLGYVNAGDMVRLILYSERQSGSGTAPTGAEFIQIYTNASLRLDTESSILPTLGEPPIYLTGTSMATNSVDGGLAKSDNLFDTGLTFTDGFAFELGVEFTDFSFGYGVPCGFEDDNEIDLEYYTNSGDDPGKAMLALYDRSTQYYAEFFLLELNTPYHIIAMHDQAGAGLYSFYVNGDAYWYSDPSYSAGDLSTPTSLNVADNPFYVGSDPYFDPIDGTVDEPALYFTSLSDERARTHYRAFTSAGGPSELFHEAVGITDTATYRVHPERHRFNEAVGISGSFAPVVHPKTRILHDTVGINVFEMRANLLSLYTEIMRDSPYVYYRLDEAAGPGPYGSTPFADSSGNGYDLDVVPSATYGVASLQHEGWGTFDLDPAAAFVAGGSQYAQTNNPVIPANTDIGTFAIEAIIKPYYPEGASSQWPFSGLGLFILRVEHQTSTTYSLTLQWNWGDSLNYSIQTLAVPATWNYGDVHQVIVEWDGTNANFYVDGALIVTEAQPHGLKTHSAFGANMLLGNGNYTGALDEVAFYDHDLGPTRVTAHYNALLAGVPSSAFADFSQPVGISATLDATTTGVPWTEIYQVTKPDSIADPSYSPDGTLILFAEHIGSDYNISTVAAADGTGHTVLVTGSRPYHDPQYSADGDFVLYSIMTVDPDGGHPLGQWAIKYLDPDGTEFTIVDDEHVHIHPVWITATQIAFQQIRYGIDGTYHIVLMDVAGHLIVDDGVGEYPRLVQV